MMSRFTAGRVRIYTERKAKNATVPLNLGVPITSETAVVSQLFSFLNENVLILYLKSTLVNVLAVKSRSGCN